MPDRILVVDDEVDTINIAKLILEGEGYQVITAFNGTGALQKADSERPDLMLLDMVMPDKSGLEVCRTLKAQPKTRHIPVVMFTVLSREVDRKLARDVGADSFLSKPFTPESLLAEIRGDLDKARVGKFSGQLGIEHGTLRGRKILLEFSPSTCYDRLIRDFVIEYCFHGEKVVILTKTGNILQQAIDNEANVKLLDMTPNVFLSVILKEYPEGWLCIIIDNLTDLALTTDLMMAYKFTKNSIELLSDKRVTAVFLLNPFAHEQRDVSSFRGLFSSQLAFGEQGIVINKLP